MTNQHLRLTSLPIGLIVVLASSGVMLERAWAADPAVDRKVARIELARSIRAFAAATLANGQCLVKAGRLSQQQNNQAMPIALRELGISSAVLTNPQVIKAAGMLQQELDDNCGLSSMSEAEALKLVTDEL